MSTPTVDLGFTVDDLEAMRDDGRRYELIGGAIVVTPSPGTPHQRASRRLENLIERACPPGYEMFHAPVDLDLRSGERVIPDIVVVPDSRSANSGSSRPSYYWSSSSHPDHAPTTTSRSALRMPQRASRTTGSSTPNVATHSLFG